MTKTAYVVATQTGGQDVFFTGMNGDSPHFIDNVLESMFMNEKDAIRLNKLLNEKSEARFEIIEIDFEE